MKKFLIVCGALILILAGWWALSGKLGLFIDLRPGADIETFTTVNGKEILVDTGEGFQPFEIRGINMGVGIPGHFATDYAIGKDTYLRWFRQIQEMGANCIRVYTIQDDSFYNAMWEYNHDNPIPLYFLHGLWVDDYIQYSHRDAYDPEFIDAVVEDSKILVDVLHGNKKFSLGVDLGQGTYNKDVSSWCLGYILGVEWEDTTVEYTNRMQDTRNSYQGKYMYTTEEASPFEAMLAMVGDRIIEYETVRYKQQRLVAFSNWPTTDPLEWDKLVQYYFRKFAKVDVEHIKTTDEFLSGQFASYHIYPYYPDYLGFLDTMGGEVASKEEFTSSNGVFNSYRAYLDMINDHHTMPVVIAEYGVPSSRGRAQNDRNTGRAQGGMSEKEQGQALVTCYEDIMASGCAGSIAFTWQDEWFKRTWNTMAYTDLNKTPYWSDYQTNEQYFGILSFDPGEGKSVCYVDGDVSEWTDEDKVIEQDGMSLWNKYDEKYVYFRVHKEQYDPETDILYLPLDITPKTGSAVWEEKDGAFERAADFILVLDGKEDSRLLVQERYEALRAIYSQRAYMQDAYLNEPVKDTPHFVEIRMMLQVPNDPHDEIDNSGWDIGETYNTGNLTYGNGNPDSPDFNSLADFFIEGDNIEIRLPWLLLNFLNPSEMEIHDDYYVHYGIEGLKIDGIYAGVGTLGSREDLIEMGRIELEGWGRNPTSHERLKQGYYDLQEIWAGKQ